MKEEEEVNVFIARLVLLIIIQIILGIAVVLAWIPEIILAISLVIFLSYILWFCRFDAKRLFKTWIKYLRGNI